MSSDEYPTLTADEAETHRRFSADS